MITIRGRQLLATADVVLYDRLASAELLQYARRDAELICVGKTPRRPSISQKQLNRLLVSLVQSGKRVCRLKGGDPFIFGRGGEELEALAEAGLKFQVVPGVSAAEGCAAYAGIPLTLRGVAHAVLLDDRPHARRRRAAIGEFQPGQTLALYMGVAQYAEISEALIANGYARETPVAVVESGTTDRQRVVRTALAACAAAQVALEIEPPALLIVGETTRYAERYSWFAPSKIEHFDDESADAQRSCKLPTNHQQGGTMIYESILDTIGNTPVVKLHRIAPKHVTIYVKIEAFNPLSSVKDRLAFAIIDDAERRGAVQARAKPSSRRRRATPASRSRWYARRGAIRSSRRWSRRSPSSGARSCARSARR